MRPLNAHAPPPHPRSLVEFSIEKQAAHQCFIAFGVILLKEFNDGHDEEHTVREFLDFCSGVNEAGWKSKDGGGYLKDGGTMVDQRFCPRIKEGETRLLMAGDNLIRVEHFKYGDDGGIAGCDTTIYKADDPKYEEEETRALLKKAGSKHIELVNE